MRVDYYVWVAHRVLRCSRLLLRPALLGPPVRLAGDVGAGQGDVGRPHHAELPALRPAPQQTCTVNNSNFETFHGE